MYQIETNVTLPTRPAKSWTRKYPWHDLGVGDSFLVTDTPAKTVQVSCSNASQRLNRRFISRKVAGGVRVWRQA